MRQAFFLQTCQQIIFFQAYLHKNTHARFPTECGFKTPAAHSLVHAPIACINYPVTLKVGRSTLQSFFLSFFLSEPKPHPIMVHSPGWGYYIKKNTLRDIKTKQRAATHTAAKTWKYFPELEK